MWNCVEQTWSWRGGVLYWLFKADASLPAFLHSILFLYVCGVGAYSMIYMWA